MHHFFGLILIRVSFNSSFLLLLTQVLRGFFSHTDVKFIFVKKTIIKLKHILKDLGSGAL